MAKVPQPENDGLRSSGTISGTLHCPESVCGTESDLSIRGVGGTLRAVGGHSEKGVLTLRKKWSSSSTKKCGGGFMEGKEGLLLGGEGEPAPTRDLGGLIVRPGFLGQPALVWVF